MASHSLIEALKTHLWTIKVVNHQLIDVGLSDDSTESVKLSCHANELIEKFYAFLDTSASVYDGLSGYNKSQFQILSEETLTTCTSIQFLRERLAKQTRKLFGLIKNSGTIAPKAMKK